MTDKPNARELLKEARDALKATNEKLTDAFNEADCCPMRNVSHSKTAKLGEDTQTEDLLAKLDSYLAAPSESAMETVRKIRDGHYELMNPDFSDDDYFCHDLPEGDAATLIEEYGRRVPRKMCEHLYNAGVNSVLRPPRPNVVDEITSEFGVKVEG